MLARTWNKSPGVYNSLSGVDKFVPISTDLGPTSWLFRHTLRAM